MRETKPNSSSGPLDPFAEPAGEEESIEGKVALEAIPSMRRWTSHEYEIQSVPRPWWVKGLWLSLAAFAVGAIVAMAMRWYG